MNNHAKRCMKHLEALGFERDHDAQTKGRAYRHPNAPDQVLKVFDHMTDNTITAVRKRAEQIAATGNVGKVDVPTVKERAVVHRRKESQRQARERAAVEERARQAEAEHEARERIRQAEARRREIEKLMRPGNGK